MIKNKKEKAFGFILIRSWEFYIFILLVLVFIISYMLSPELITGGNLIDATILFMENSIIALAMAVAIISGIIDISVAAIAALSGVVLGVCYRAGLDIGFSIVIGLLAGLFAGFLNGLIITKLKMPSIIVTLAMLFFYRGICYILLGDLAIRDLPQNFGILGGAVETGIIPIPFIIYLVLAIIFAYILHFTSFGRKVYSIGNNENAAFFSGIDVGKIRLIVTSTLGFVAGLSGILLTSRIGSARPDIANGNEMAIITICLLGGIYIFGGRGSILGVVISSFIIGYLYYGLSIKRVQDTRINIITGLVLIIALVVPIIINRINERRLIKKELLKDQMEM
jgi:rhamnose transport system permease protein